MQVSGVMITREYFMVSIFDYNKDAEDAERAEKVVAAGTAERNLSDGPGRRGSCGGGGTAGGGGAEGSGGRSRPCEDGEDRFAGWQWVWLPHLVPGIMTEPKKGWISVIAAYLDTQTGIGRVPQ